MAVSMMRRRFAQALASLVRPLPRAAVLTAAALGNLCILSADALAQVPQAPRQQWSFVSEEVDVDESGQRQNVNMVINTSREITASESFVQVRVQNPSVLTALPLAPNRLQVSAIGTGVTQVDLVGQDNSVHSIEVLVLGDVRELESVLQHNFPDGNLSVFPIQQGCIVRGTVTSPDHVDQVIQIAELYFPNVINKVDVSGVFTIQLETQILEVSRTKLRELGIDWAFGNGDDAISSTVNGLISATGTAFGGTGQEVFKVGVIENGSTFFSGIRALRRNNLVKVMAEPKLVAVDGRPASFNSGGEIPIVVPAGLGQVAVQFREYGTRLDYVAKVRDNGRIWVEVRPYVSEVDPSRAVTISGVSVPGFRSRYLETGVELGAGQTLALAGLLQVKSESVNSGLPILSDMPYLGSLFRTVREETNEIELLVLVTPNYAGPLDPSEVPCIGPGMTTQSPTDHDLYHRGFLEVPAEPVMNGDTYLLGPAQQEVMSTGQIVPQGMLHSPTNGTTIPGGEVYQSAPGGPQVYPSYQNGGSFQPGAGPINPTSAPTPNPAAMSVGPNAPRLATSPQQPSNY